MMTLTLQMTGNPDMPARKIKNQTQSMVGAAGPVRAQPSYHDEISDEYLVALQAKVDSSKPQGFRLTPISAPGW